MIDNNHSSDRKVTLSCRVLPEQKLIIAERAQELGMSTAQYVEAKVLRKDVFPLEKKIEKQHLEIENLQMKLLSTRKKKEVELQKTTAFYEEKLKVYKSKLKEIEAQNGNRFILSFSDANRLKVFKDELNLLAKKYGFENLARVLKMCVRYTLKNDQSSFILERVAGFVKKNFKN